MTIDKKFVAGVGRTFNYDSNDNLLWVGKTLLNSSIEISTGSEQIRAGQGNQLHMIYYHSGEMSITQEEQQFNLSMIARTVGSSVVTGANVWEEETVTLTAGSGTVDGTPIATSSGAIFGWAELSDGSSERFTFSGSDFSLNGQSSGDVLVRYYKANSAARQVTVNANIIPSVVRTVIEAQMFSGDPSNVSASTLVGKVLVEVPRLQLDGTANLSLTTTGVSSTPLNGMALADSAGNYATITEVVSSANWYDNVGLIAVADNDIEIEHPDTYQLEVWAIPTNGDAPFIAPVGDLTFTSGTVGTCTVGENTGLITTVGVGDSVITIVITNKNTVGTSVIATVTAD